jgi:DNA repair exonuclease SbcCD nuclease subunit
MHLYVGSDLHARATRPVNRIDDFVEAQAHKVEYMVQTAMDDVLSGPMLWAGDLFDAHDVPYSVVERYIRIFDNGGAYGGVPFAAVFGQHDQRYHTSEKRNTPLGTLLAGVTGSELLGTEPFRLSSGPMHKEVRVYGKSWGESTPHVEVDPSVVNVLVAHQMTTLNGPLWPGQEGYVNAVDMLKAHPGYRFIITGDNHQTFTASYRGRYLINCGSVMREAVDQLDHLPCFFIIDTEAGMAGNAPVTRIPFPIESTEKVFNVAKVEEIKIADAKLEDFIVALKRNTTVTVDFRTNLAIFLDANNVKQSVRDTIGEVMA